MRSIDWIVAALARTMRKRLDDAQYGARLVVERTLDHAQDVCQPIRERPSGSMG